MSSKSNLKYLMIPFLIIIVLFVILYIAICIFFGKSNKNTIIKNYQKNHSLFEQIAKELLENPEENIEFSTIASDFPVVIYQYDEERNLLEIKKENSELYKNIFLLMSNLKLKKVTKKHGNIIFTTNVRWNIGQYLVFMSDEENFKKEYKILYCKQLNNNWFYVEIN